MKNLSKRQLTVESWKGGSPHEFEVEKALSELSGIRDCKVREITGGFVNYSYEVSTVRNRYYLKMFSDRFVNKIPSIHAYMDELRLLGFPVAKILSKVRNPHYEGAYLYEFVCGTTFDFQNKGHSYSLGSQLGKVLKASDVLHCRKQEGGYGIEQKIEHICNFRKWSSEFHFKENLMSMFYELSRLSFLVEPIVKGYDRLYYGHGDFTHRNVLFGENNEIVLICDFDECGMRPLLHEIAITLARTFLNTGPGITNLKNLRELISSFIHGFESTFGLANFESLKKQNTLWRYILLECLNGINWRVGLALREGVNEEGLFDIIHNRLAVCLWVEGHFYEIMRAW